MRILILLSFIITVGLTACNNNQKAKSIIRGTIDYIDNIKTVQYDQILVRGNTGSETENITTSRSFYFERLSADSIIGAKAHIDFFDGNIVFHEDIYNGKKLIRKHNADSTAQVYDLERYPALKKQHFWGKTTPWVIQYMLQYALDHERNYRFMLGIDTIINQKSCYTVKTILNGMALMPGYNEFEIDDNRVETMVLFVDKELLYPQAMRLETFFKHNTDLVYFTDHRFGNIRLNPELDSSLFSVSDTLLKGFEVKMLQP